VFAAARPARAWGMLPLVAALVACLLATSVLDVSARNAGFGETTHALELAGLGFLWLLARPMHSGHGARSARTTRLA
jgi:hypothetical protein